MPQMRFGGSEQKRENARRKTEVSLFGLQAAVYIGQSETEAEGPTGLSHLRPKDAYSQHAGNIPAVPMFTISRL